MPRADIKPDRTSLPGLYRQSIPRRPASRRRGERRDDLGSSRLEVGEVTRREFLHRERRPDPENVDRTVHAVTIDERHRDRREAVVGRR